MRIIDNLAKGWLLMLIFCLPHKFANGVNYRYSLNIPLDMNIADWLLYPWPPILTAVISGLALLFVILASNKLKMSDFKAVKHLIIAMLLMIVAAAVGIINSTEREVAEGFIFHMIGAFCFFSAVFIHIKQYPESKKLILLCIVCSMLLLSVHSSYQVAYGNKAALEQYIEQSEKMGTEPNPQLVNRMKQNRASANFNITNSLGAHFIALIPICLAFIWGFIKKHPFRLYIIIAAAAFLLLNLYFTRSRGAMVGLTVGLIGTALLFYLQSRKTETALRLNRRYLLIAAPVIVIVISPHS